MEYYKSGRNNQLVDPTPEKRYIHAKAKKEGFSVKSRNTVIKNAINPVFRNYRFDSEGWTKLLNNLPAISNTEISNFQMKMSKPVMDASTSIAKPYKR